MEHLNLNLTDEMPNLPNNHTLESINNKVKKSTNILDNLKTTETDMHVNLLANSEKLITENRRWNYEDGMLDDNIDNYMGGKSNINESRIPINKMDDKDGKDGKEVKNSIFNKKTDKDTKDTKETKENKNNYSDKTSENHKKNDDDDMSEEDMMLKKLDMLRKLAELAQAGVKLSQNYNMQSDYKMMKYEYELHKSVRAKQNGINWMSSMNLNMIYGLEMLNEKHNPFDLKLKKWSEYMNADVNSYYDIFGELYEKYNQPGKNMGPELKFFLMISGSALKVHLSNTMMESMPTLNDSMDKDPQIAEQLRQKAFAENANKMRDINAKNNEALKTNINKEHMLASQKVSDVQMIKQKELEQMESYRQMAIKKAEMERQMEQLQGQLSLQQQMQTNSQPTMQIPQQVRDMMAKNIKSPQLIQQEKLIEQQQFDLNKKKLEALDAQKKTVEMTDHRLKQEYLAELGKIKQIKKQEERLLASEKSRKKDTNSHDSQRSVVNVNSDIDAFLDKSKAELNKKVQKSIDKATNSDTRVVTIDTVDEDGISIGDSKKSMKSAKSGKSKASVNGKKLKPNSVGINIF
jgi:hypothetical protein